MQPMSRTTILGVTPNRRPVALVELPNSHGWGPSIWGRLLRHHGYDDNWLHDHRGLNALWNGIETLPEWQQIPLVLTFDTGVIPCSAFGESADLLDEFDRRIPAPANHANHVPAVATLLRSGPETPLVGVHVTSVTGNPFGPWDDENDEPGSGIPLGAMYVLPAHQDSVLRMFGIRSDG